MHIEQQLMAAETLARNGDEESGLEVLDAVLEQAPEDWRVWSARGYILGRQSRFLEKIKALSRAIALCVPDEPDLFFQRGRARYVAGDLHGAAEDFSKTIDVDSNRGSEYYRTSSRIHRAAVLLELRKAKDVLSDLYGIADAVIIGGPKSLLSVANLRKRACELIEASSNSSSKRSGSK